VVRAGLNITLDIGLQLGNVSQSVEVSAGDSPLLETFSAEQAVDISGELVRNLTLTGRPGEWSDTLQLTSGILSATVSNPMATIYRFVYANRGDGPLWTPWLTTWNTRIGREFAIREKTVGGAGRGHLQHHKSRRRPAVRERRAADQ
jgi:hypothetical protein